MAEESGKGIALVILGIVAIIAIVGLVLLFTGAKGQTGEFAVPVAKEYGGSIRGVFDPESRAFPGRAVQFPSGQFGQDKEGTYSGLGARQQKVANTVYGEDGTPKTVSQKLSYNRNQAQVPSFQTTCQGLVLSNLDPTDDSFLNPADTQQYSSVYQAFWGPQVNEHCRAVQDLLAVFYTTPDYGLEDFLTAYPSQGEAYCCDSSPWNPI